MPKSKPSKSKLAPRSQAISGAAREALGYKRLRPGQERAVRAVLDGHDVLAVMPTGSGKSAIYQLAGLLVEGQTVVVSPLLALQRDQLRALEELDPEGGEAAALNSTLTQAERERLLERSRTGGIEFLFLSPEQLANPETIEELRHSQPSLFVVDEAHCISDWGHDFRPDYLRLGEVIDALGRPRVLALTATAAAPVRDEIVERLHMKGAVVFVYGFDRPNLRLEVERVSGEAEKLSKLLELLPELEKPGIVYVATRNHADEVAEEVHRQGWRAAAYHAGHDKTRREHVQSQFMADELDVIVATTAFGMGVDKPHVGFVVHYDIPGSLDSYYQQVGRAGRDGEPARAILLYLQDDLRLQRFLNSGAAIDLPTHERVAALIEGAGKVDASELKEITELSATRLQTVLNQFAEVGVVDLRADGVVQYLKKAPPATEAAAAAQELQMRHKSIERSRVDMMRSYAETDLCRRAFILSYFGEEFEPPCGNCDVCLAGGGQEQPAEGPYPIGSNVNHGSFGDGQVVRYEHGKVVVLFEEIGYQELDLAIVEEGDLLRPADST